jgi:hypothetical protein
LKPHHSFVYTLYKSQLCGLQGDEGKLRELCKNEKTGEADPSRDRVIVKPDSLELSYTLLSIRGVSTSMNKYTKMNPLRTTSPTIFSNSNPAKE